ncbi:MAG: Rrf2 family transcriptional regulator [Anaerolineales bacterium]
MQITRQADYAVRAVLELASNGNKQRLTAEEIARRRAIPLAFLSKTLGRLSESGIVTTQRGVKGGVSLGRPASEINLLEVVEVIDGPIALNECVLDEEACRWTGTCPVHDVWCTLQHSLRDQMAGMNFHQLAQQYKVEPAALAAGL